MKWIEIKYKCRCMQAEATMQMRARLPNEDTADYMDRLMMAISVDHNNRSPLCRATTMEYAKLPFENQRVGDPGGGTA